jgi:hypothetical protein
MNQAASLGIFFSLHYFLLVAAAKPTNIHFLPRVLLLRVPIAMF